MIDIDKLARNIGRAFDRGGEAEADRVLADIRARHGRGIEIAVLERWETLERLEEAQRLAEFEFERRRFAAPDRAFLVEIALANAAVRRHPGWRVTRKGFEKIDTAAPDRHGLVEWFQKNYPREAREIERSV